MLGAVMSIMAILGQPLLRLLIVVLGGILTFSCRPNAEGTKLCETKQKTTKRIDLCHDQPRSKPDGPYRCKTQWDGFVLKDLKIAPQPEFSDCGSFRVDGFLEKCSHDEHHQVAVESDDDGGDGFESAVFHLLGKVSGKGRIDNDTVVKRVTFAEPVSSSSSSAARKEGSSAFVSFKSLCKPVRPAVINGEPNGVLKICSHQKVNSSYVFLVFHGDDLNPDLDPSRDALVRCRCTLRASHTVVLRALDIRLQGSGGQECPPGASIKFQSKNETGKAVRCEGLAAHYDLDLLYSSEHEVTLDLFVSTRAPLPIAVWIQASEGYLGTLANPIEASCEGTRVLEENWKSDTNVAVIVGSAVGGVVVLAALVVIIVFIIVTIRTREPQVWTRMLSSFRRKETPPSDTPGEQGGNDYTRECGHPPNNHDYTDIEDPAAPFIDHPHREAPSVSPPPVPTSLPCPKKPDRAFTYDPAQESGRRANDAEPEEEEYNHLNHRSARLRPEGEAGDMEEGAVWTGRNSREERRGREDYNHLDMNTLTLSPPKSHYSTTVL